MTFSIALLMLSSIPRTFGLSEKSAMAMSIIAISTSFITALRLKPVKGADFLKEDPAAPFNAKPPVNEKALENVKDTKASETPIETTQNPDVHSPIHATTPPKAKPEGPPDLIALWDAFIQYVTQHWRSKMELLGIFGIGLLLSIHKNVPFWLPVGYTVVFALAIFVAPRFVRFLPFIAICISCYIRYFTAA